MLLGLITCLSGGCITSRTESQTAQKAVSEILSTDYAPIQKYIRLQSGETIKVVDCWTNNNLYIVFLAPQNNRSVIYDLGNFSSGRKFYVENYGYGELDSSGEWEFVHNNNDFESQGGIWTIKRFTLIAKRAVSSRALTNFMWDLKN